MARWGCALSPGPPHLCLGKHCRSSAPAAALARPAVTAVSSDDWMTGSLSARAIPGTLKKQFTEKRKSLHPNLGWLWIPQLQQDQCYKNIIRIRTPSVTSLTRLSRFLRSDICSFEENNTEIMGDGEQFLSVALTSRP